MPNGIITRGYGTSRTILTRGYGSFVRAVVEVARRGYVWGRSSYDKRKEKLAEIIVSAWLVDVNDGQKHASVKGSTRVTYDRTGVVYTLVEHVSTSIKRAWSGILITVARVRREDDAKRKRSNQP